MRKIELIETADRMHSGVRGEGGKRVHFVHLVQFHGFSDRKLLRHSPGFGLMGSSMAILAILAILSILAKNNCLKFE